MSLTKEVAHDLRPVAAQPAGSTVLPGWAKIIPVAFYAGFVFFILGLAYNTFNANIYGAKSGALGHIIQQYQQMIQIDQQTTSRLIAQRNTAVRVARWVDYSPMLQTILVSLFGSFDQRIQLSSVQIERKEGVRPEYTVNLYFRAAQGDISGIIRAAHDALQAKGWLLTTGAQVYQDSVTNFQGYLQPIDSQMPFESQYLSVLQEQGASTDVPAPPTTGSVQ